MYFEACVAFIAGVPKIFEHSGMIKIVRSINFDINGLIKEI